MIEYGTMAITANTSNLTMPCPPVCADVATAVTADMNVLAMSRPPFCAEDTAYPAVAPPIIAQLCACGTVLLYLARARLNSM